MTSTILTNFFGYELDKFQHEAITAIDAGNHVLVTAHTGAGKSTVAEYTIYKYIQDSRKVIYTSPIKTLSNQKYQDFVGKWGIDNVGIITGDIKLNETSPILIMTTEVLRNAIFNRRELLADVAAVIFDEVHYINDDGRGFVWEEAITQLAPEIQLIMLSATFSNAPEFAAWITRIKDKETRVVSTSYRPVPLNFYGFNRGKEYYIMNDKYEMNQTTINDLYESFKPSRDPSKKTPKDTSAQHRIGEFVEFMEREARFPLLFFIFSRKDCEKYARSIERTLISPAEGREIDQIYKNIFRGPIAFMRERPYMIDLMQIINKGVAYHHSGLIPVLKEFIEILFNKGLIKVLFATETFAVGVNMPTRSVCFTKLEKMDTGVRYLRNDEFIQMSGRAGRRGKDTVGFVYYLPVGREQLLPEITLKSIYLGKGRIISSKIMLKPSRFLTYLNNENNESGDFLHNTLFCAELTNEKKILENGVVKLAADLQQLEQQREIYLSGGILTAREKEEWETYCEKCAALRTMRGKQYKRLEMQVTAAERDFSNSLRLFRDNHVKIGEIGEKITAQREHIRELTTLTADIYEQGIIFAEKCGLISGDREKTTLGKIVAQLDCENEILLGTIIEQKLFLEMQPRDFVVLLSLFFDERGGKTNLEQIRNILEQEHQNGDIVDIIRRYVVPMHERIISAGSVAATTYFKLYNEELYLDIVAPLHFWLNGMGIDQVAFYYDGFIGNFVKNVFQLRELVARVVAILEQMGEITFINGITEVMTTLIRDETVFYSIYIQN